MVAESMFLQDLKNVEAMVFLFSSTQHSSLKALIVDHCIIVDKDPNGST
jgi:hypothetical protein